MAFSALPIAPPTNGAVMTPTLSDDDRKQAVMSLARFVSDELDVDLGALLVRHDSTPSPSPLAMSCAVRGPLGQAISN